MAYVRYFKAANANVVGRFTPEHGGEVYRDGAWHESEGVESTVFTGDLGWDEISEGEANAMLARAGPAPP